MSAAAVQSAGPSAMERVDLAGVQRGLVEVFKTAKAALEAAPPELAGKLKLVHQPEAFEGVLPKPDDEQRIQAGSCIGVGTHPEIVVTPLGTFNLFEITKFTTKESSPVIKAMAKTSTAFLKALGAVCVGGAPARNEVLYNAEGPVKMGSPSATGHHTILPQSLVTLGEKRGKAHQRQASFASWTAVDNPDQFSDPNLAFCMFQQVNGFLMYAPAGLSHPPSFFLPGQQWMGGYSPVTLEDLTADQPVSKLADLSKIVWTADYDGFDAGPRTWAQLEADKANNRRVPTSPYTLYTTPYAPGVVSQLRSAPDLDVHVHVSYRVKDDDSGLESYIYLWVKEGDETKINEATGIKLPIPKPEGGAASVD